MIFKYIHSVLIEYKCFCCCCVCINRFLVISSVFFFIKSMNICVYRLKTINCANALFIHYENDKQKELSDVWNYELALDIIIFFFSKWKSHQNIYVIKNFSRYMTNNINEFFYNCNLQIVFIEFIISLRNLIG